MKRVDVDKTVVDAEFTEVNEEETNKDLLNLDDVAYMVMVGRTKDGQPFVRASGVKDILLVKGLLDYAVLDVEHSMSQDIANRHSRGE